MGLKIKKGERGTGRRYLSRTQALRKLQVTLNDFRRLCILKGIYPRVPEVAKSLKSNAHRSTFYYLKDIQFLSHDPLLRKFREHKIFVRKLTKLIAKREQAAKEALEENRPVYTLDHLVKERYPTFVDALRDLDDALSLLTLFSRLPKSRGIPQSRIHNCRTLMAEFQHYVMHASALRKVFFSVKGIYYQAEIKGTPITWLVPYEFNMPVPRDVDVRVMLTFLEFYETLLGFVNFQLYTELNLAYPPRIDEEAAEAGEAIDGCRVEPQSVLGDIAADADSMDTDMAKPAKTTVSARQMASLQKKVKEISARTAMDQEDNNTAAESADETTDIGADLAEFVTAAQTTRTAQSAAAGEEEEEEQDDSLLKVEELQRLVDSAGSDDRGTLFAGKVFFISREVPRTTLLFLVRSFGGQVGWDATVAGGSPFGVDDPRITYQISDRPNLAHTVLGRKYVQPQWVADSINFGKLMEPNLYAPGRALPAHLSPFVEYRAGDYVPEEAKTLAQGGVTGASLDDDEEEEVTDSDEDNEEEDQLEAELKAERAGVSSAEFAAKNKAKQSKKGANKSSTKATETPKAAVSKKRNTKAAETEAKAAELQDLTKALLPNRKRRIVERLERQTKADQTEKLKLQQRKDNIKRQAKKQRS
ncbi:mRNA-binding ribosome synthesis protein nop7 [Tieghemiomyces parasiticus]|uniref:Pescadillo homolog n=1 Tax=Tieghemiomyces parasiticus TaxID=78921 RepID=A0A9W8AKJ2_9FUNG|nr:mRNA-binding ribosome synthesis protein nop7 [Tieghemiomyces parasiticus]